MMMAMQALKVIATMRRDISPADKAQRMRQIAKVMLEDIARI